MNHAILSASGAHRWLSCPPSARLEAQIPDSGSEYAAEGALAHEIAELKLTKYFTPMGPQKFNRALKKLRDKPLFQEEMLKHTDTYLDYIAGIVHSFTEPPYAAVEKKVDYSSYAPEGFGTADCVLITGNTLMVIDFKYGTGVAVDAEDNPQLKLYALGAYLEYSFLYPITKVKMIIIQPRKDRFLESEISVEELLSWGEQIKPIARLAHAGEGAYQAGEHCRFCRAKAMCRARTEHYLSFEEQAQNPVLSNSEIGEILERAQAIEKWVSNLKDFALKECLAGREIPGWKAIEGKSNRTFTNQEEAFKKLIASGIQEAMLYERKPITLTKVEDLLGKPVFKELMNEFVYKPKGSPALAKETDKREPYQAITPEEAFGQPINTSNTTNTSNTINTANIESEAM